MVGASAWWRALLFGSVLLLAVGVRLFGLTTEPFWLDEIFSFKYSSGTLRTVIDSSNFDAHPPLYYLTLWLWRLAFGSSEFVVRLLSTIWSLVGIAAAMVFSSQLARDWRAGLLAGAFGAILPLDVYFAQEARNYAQAGALFALSSWLLWKWLGVNSSVVESRARPQTLGAYVAVSVMLLYTHYLGVVLLGAQAAWTIGCLLTRSAWRFFFHYTAAIAAASACLAPWLSFVHYRGGYLEPKDWVGWIGAPTLVSSFEPFTRYLLWGNAPLLPGGQTTTALVCMALLTGIVAAALTKRNASIGESQEGSLFPAWLVAAPVAIAVTLSLVYQPVYFAPRFSQLLAPVFIVAVSVPLHRASRHWPGVMLVAALLSVASYATSMQQRSIEKSAPRQFVTAWKSQGPPDLAVLIPDWEHVVVDYYLERPIPRARTRGEIVAVRDREGGLRVWLCVLRHYSLTSADEELKTWLFSQGDTRPVADTEPFVVTEIMLY